MSKPCEKCGHCPACGRGGYQTYPSWPYYPPSYPWPNTWITSKPYYGTHTFTNDSTTRFQNLSISSSANAA